jgi:aminoglycoside phosphotransferase (APT) family kinase protein
VEKKVSILKAKDFGDRRTEFQAWLSKSHRLGAGTVVEALGGGNGGAGYSNRTIMADVRKPSGQCVRYVVRFGPSAGDPSLFPVYDMRKQFDIPRALARETDLPVAPGIWFEDDDTIFGSPFFIMDFVPGRIPADEPPYGLQGFVVDATPQQQATMWWSAVDVLVELAKVDPFKLDVPSLQLPVSGKTPLAAVLDELDDVYVWARGDSGPFPEYERARDWLRAEMPKDQRTGLVWSDARFANFIFDSDFRVTCALDWELATVGSPELDLAYFLLFDRMSQNHMSPALSAPRPPGFPSPAETIDYYQEKTGIEVSNMPYYTALSIYKNLTYFQRFCEMMFEAGRLTRAEAEHIKVTSGPNVRWMSEIVEGVPVECQLSV